MTPNATPRPDGRKPSEMRAVTIETGALKHAEGSALIALGSTRACSARPRSKSASPRS